MAKAAVLVRISPEDQDKLENTIAIIKDKYNPVDIGTEDIGFGIKVIKALFHIDEDKGSSYLEEELQKIDNVSSVDILAVDRLG